MAIDLEKLQKAGERYNSSLQKIGEMLDDLAHYISELLPEELGDVKFTAEGITFWRYGPSSNLASLGPAFWDEEEWGLLSTTRKPGSSFYLHGDYHAQIGVASRKARREAAKNIEKFLAAFLSWLDKLAEDTEVLSGKLQKALEAM